MEMQERRIRLGDGLLQDWVAKQAQKPGEVVMVMLRPGGKVLLTTKDFYPAGVYRLPSGGMHRGETPEEALVREAQEETGFSVTIERKLAGIHWVFEHGDRSIEFYSHIFLIAETRGQPVCEDPDEGITGFREVGVCELGNVAEQLRSLTGRWHDWGVFRAIPHEVVYHALCPPR